MWVEKLARFYQEKMVDMVADRKMMTMANDDHYLKWGVDMMCDQTLTMMADIHCKMVDYVRIGQMKMVYMDHTMVMVMVTVCIDHTMAVMGANGADLNDHVMMVADMLDVDLFQMDNKPVTKISPQLFTCITLANFHKCCITYGFCGLFVLPH